MRIMACLLVALLGSPAIGEAQADEVPRLDALVERLGSRSYRARERAAAELRRMGRSALRALESAGRSASLEVRLRAAELARHIRRHAPRHRVSRRRRCSLALLDRPWRERTAEEVLIASGGVSIEGVGRQLREAERKAARREYQRREAGGR